VEDCCAPPARPIAKAPVSRTIRKGCLPVACLPGVFLPIVCLPNMGRVTSERLIKQFACSARKELGEW